jgi:hypothetical protein
MLSQSKEQTEDSSNMELEAPASWLKTDKTSVAVAESRRRVEVPLDGRINMLTKVLLSIACEMTTLDRRLAETESTSAMVLVTLVIKVLLGKVKLILKGRLSLRPDICTDASVTPKSCITKLQERDPTKEFPAKSCTRDTVIVIVLPMTLSNYKCQTFKNTYFNSTAIPVYLEI